MTNKIQVLVDISGILATLGAIALYKWTTRKRVVPIKNVAGKNKFSRATR